MAALPTSSHDTSPIDPVPLRDDALTIGLVGLAHGTSHFFHLLLPTLFPMFIRDFGYSYAELGLLVSTFFVVSGVGQALSGFVVDRIGARPMLFASLGCFALAAFAVAMAGSYAGLMVAAVLAGVGNCSFHPVDFTILNRRISAPRLGHAFSVHGLSGNLGWAAAPVFLTGLTALTGSWRVAAACAGLVALVVMVVLWLQREAVDDRHVIGGLPEHSAAAPATTVQGAIQEHPLAFLRLPSVWLCFSFFFWSTCALSAIQGFAGPALQHMNGLPLSTTSLVVTGYMLFGVVGMVLGGFLAARSERLETLIGACLLLAALMLALVGSGLVGGIASAVLTAAAGFGTGLAGPSRDMLIKRAAPPGATGRVYGTVYSGLDLGFALAAPVFGLLLDRGLASGVFYGSAITLVMAVVSASAVGWRLQRRGGSAPAMARAGGSV
jgi:MFS family permease